MSTEISDVTGPEIAGRIEVLQKKVRQLAPDASARLALAASNLKRVSPDAAYTWIDPSSFSREVESGASRGADRLHSIRNILVLVPLTFTWLALALAGAGYYADISAHKEDDLKPFLELWQGNFHNAFPLTISLTEIGIFDFIVLIIILLLTWRAQIIERNARLTAQTMTAELSGITSELVTISARRGRGVTVGADASVQDVANAMQAVIDDALQESRQIAEHAKASITLTQQSMSDLLTKNIGPMIDTFSGHLTTLQTQLGSYQARLDSLAAASQRIADGADALGRNAGTYMDAAEQMSKHIEALRMTQDDLLAKIDRVGTTLTESADALKHVATSIGADAVQRIRDVSINLAETTDSLRETTQGLETATTGLDLAARNLSAVQIVGGGFFGWLLNRRQSRRARGL
jgi:hypothetical protein